MWENSKLNYSFSCFKLYIGGIVFLCLAFVFFWFPSARIEVELVSQPVSTSFLIKVSSRIDKILFNLDTLPARLVDKEQTEESSPDEEFVSGEEQALIWRKADLEELLDYKIKLLLGEDAYFPHPRLDYRCEVIKQDLAQGTAQLKVYLEGEMKKEYSWEKIKSELVFRPTEEAYQYFQQLEGVKTATIRTRPSFYQRLPFSPGRIVVEIID